MIFSFLYICIHQMIFYIMLLTDGWKFQLKTWKVIYMDHVMFHQELLQLENDDQIKTITRLWKYEKKS